MASDDHCTLTPRTIVFYSKEWCPDCKRSRKVLNDSKAEYQEIEISRDNQARSFVRQLNNGNESVPTIVFPDGSYLVEPKNAALLEKLKSMN